MIALPPEHRSILDAIGKLPPTSWLFTASPDQREEWNAISAGCSLLRMAMHDYFTGQADTLPDRIDRIQAEKFLALRDYFLDWYKVVQLGWGHIEDECKKRSITIPDTPGEALVYLVELFVVSQLDETTQPYFRSSPKESYRNLGTLEKLPKLSAGAQAAAMRKIQSSHALGGHIYTRYTDFLLGPIAICQKRGKQREKALQRALASFEESDKALVATLRKISHPQSGARGKNWVHGELRSG